MYREQIRQIGIKELENNVRTLNLGPDRQCFRVDNLYRSVSIGASLHTVVFTGCINTVCICCIRCDCTCGDGADKHDQCKANKKHFGDFAIHTQSPFLVFHTGCRHSGNYVTLSNYKYSNS